MPEVKRITAAELAAKCQAQGLHYPLVVTIDFTKRDERTTERNLQAYEETINGKA